jgi:hypothetical protein
MTKLMFGIHAGIFREFTMGVEEGQEGLCHRGRVAGCRGQVLVCIFSIMLLLTKEKFTK